MEQPVISVIIPVYNTSLAVRRLLALLFSQTYEKLEIICVDDGSTDDSLEQMKKLAKKEPRLKVFHQKNAGASSARNLGLDHATGEYISFLDSDDLVTLDYYDLMLNGLKIRQKSSASEKTTNVNKAKTAKTTAKTPYGLKVFPEDIKKAGAFSVCGFHYFRLSSNSQTDVFVNPLPKQKAGEPARAYLLRFMNEDGRLYSSVNKLYHASIIQDNHLRFDTAKDFAEDTKFVFDYLDAWLKKYGESRVKISPVLKPLYIYNYGTTTSTVKKSSLIWENWEKSIADFEKFAEPLPPQLAKKLVRNLRRRFRVSRALAVARVNLPREKKLKYLNRFQLLSAEIIVKFRP